MALVTVNKINTDLFEDYTPKDLNLIPAFDVISQFSPNTDNIEFSIFNELNQLEYIDYSYKNYTVTLDYNTQQNAVSTVNVDPEVDTIKAGYDQGNYTVIYNFLRNQLSSSIDNPFYLKQISSDRTELRLANNNLTNEELESLVFSFKNDLTNSAYFEDFQVNFGNNNIFIANNILLDTVTYPQYTVLIKLYEPLDIQFVEKDTLWVTLQTADEVSFNIKFAPKVVELEPSPKLRGPNFEVQLKDIINNSTPYENLTSLTTTTLTSSYNELQNLLAQKGVTVNIDYSDFNDFIYFSSAQNRVENFYYKVGLIEEYQNEINEINSLNPSDITSSIILLEKQIENIIKNFDGYEYYQYYSSGSSDIYPKNNSIPPYILASTGSASSLTWLNTQITSGSEYDTENPDRLVNNLPSFVKDDNTNASFFLFMDMIGQHFDNMWVYTKDITNRFDADNRLNYGVSKDIVSDAIRSMGVNLYQNNFSSDDLYSALLGINGSGDLLPPTGSEIITTYVTASSEVTKLDDVNKEIYKRIYHNLPYLLKKKGTVEGLRALINTYGIPDTILRISEFGGKDKDNTNDWDYFQNKFNYALFYSGSPTNNNVLKINWTVNSNWGSTSNKPQSVFFRFKPKNTLPESNEYSIITRKTGTPFYLTLDYTGSAYSSSSYSGSIPSSSNNYATLTLWESTAKLISVDAPFYDGSWWGVQIYRQPSSSTANIGLRVANSIYNGNNGFKVGYTASNFTSSTFTSWTAGVGTPVLCFPTTGSSGLVLDGNTYYGLTGSYQEVRFYNVTQSEEIFYDYVMNPYSIEGSDYSSSINNLIFRAPLGSDLITITGTRTSIHPKVTGSFITNSFSSDSNYTIGNEFIFYPQTEFIYYDQPAVGIKNRISQKIRIEDNILPSGDVLTPYRTIQQRYPQSESYTRDVNYVEVAFSPQNEINDDINSSMGYFNIGEYIGDPRQVSESSYSYPDLDRLRNSYFDKYYKNYNWNDYIRLIKYFDNSLFKMIKDFTPAKSGLSTGVVIKQHLLERNKQRPAQVEISQYDYSGSIYSQQIWDPITSDTYISNSKISEIKGGAGGIFNNLNYNYANGSTLTMRNSSGSVAHKTNTTNTVINSFGGTFGIYGITGSNGGLVIENVSQLEYPFKNITNVPIYFDFNIEGIVVNDNINAGELYILSNQRFTTSSITLFSKLQAGFIHSASLGDINVASSFSSSVQNLLIYPNESISIVITDSDTATDKFLNCSVTFSPSKLNNNFTFNTQFWNETILTPSGSIILTHKTEDEFYNGELQGTEIEATNGELNDWNTSKFPLTLEIDYIPYFYVASTSSLDIFNSNNLVPNSGEVYLWYDTGSTLNPGGGGGGPSIPTFGFGGN
jgi:hypothetical protein